MLCMPHAPPSPPLPPPPGGPAVLLSLTMSFCLFDLAQLLSLCVSLLQQEIHAKAASTPRSVCLLLFHSPSLSLPAPV